MATSTTLLRRLPLKSFDSMPGPHSLPILGTLPSYLPYIGEYQIDRLHISGMKKYQKYGSIVKEEILPHLRFVFLFDPNHIETIMRGSNPMRRSHCLLAKYRSDKARECPSEYKSAGLLPSNGPEWSQFRGQFQQSLSRENVQKYMSRTNDIADQLVQLIRAPRDPSHFSQDLLPYLMATNLEVMIAALFGKRLNSLTSIQNTSSLAWKLIHASETVNTLTMAADNSLLRLWRYFKTPTYKKLANGMDTLDRAARDYINERLQDLDKNVDDDQKDSLFELWRKSGVDIRDVITMCTDSILAGIDTTALTTGFTLYHLAKNPETQEKLYQELKRFLPSRDAPVTLEVMQEIKYLKRVIKESLRLNPISVGVGRIMPADGAIGDYEIPQGTPIVTMNQVICRMDKWFEKPNDFIPERWDPSFSKKKPHPFAWMPFGYGPRQCIARRMAEQSLYIVMAKVMRNYHVEWSGDRALDCLTHNINVPDAPLRFRFTRRS